MTEESFIASHLSVAMTTAHVTHVTGETTVTSSSSRGADFYFGCAVVIIGIVGTAATGVVLYAMVASKQHQKHALIVNQNVLDLLGCLMLVVTYALKIADIYLAGSLGYWLCVTILSENLLWCALEGSVLNLAIITVDRYVKIVHPVWSKKHVSRASPPARVQFVSFDHRVTVYPADDYDRTATWLIDRMRFRRRIQPWIRTNHRSVGVVT